MSASALRDLHRHADLVLDRNVDDLRHLASGDAHTLRTTIHNALRHFLERPEIPSQPLLSDVNKEKGEDELFFAESFRTSYFSSCRGKPSKATRVFLKYPQV